MNKQPFYHRVDGLLFTATRSISEDEFLRVMEKSLQKIGLVKGTMDIEINGYDEPEPGDPSDLM